MLTVIHAVGVKFTFDEMIFIRHTTLSETD